MVEVRYDSVTKRYENGFEAVKGLNLEIKDGEFLVLLGPSGCGKSTTLRMLAGLEDVSDGTIMIDGAKVNDLPPGARGLGMVFQSYALYPHMTIAENLS
ncbi:MAG: ABC transporter ATP-binding protein, partial [Candidatus Thermoplasmatota archaeon]|nr:ABC transporter ATP-binding protein [Candidatus Thermoplasmatota archaeon]